MVLWPNFGDAGYLQHMGWAQVGKVMSSGMGLSMTWGEDLAEQVSDGEQGEGVAEG